MVETPSINAIIQARLGSTRLPGKVLMPMIGKPMLGHIIGRLYNVPAISKVIVATSTEISDDPIADLCNTNSFNVFRGSETDVLDRFYGAVKAFPSDHLIRITGDCPLVDPDTINALIELYLQAGYDFCGVATGAGVAGKDVPGRFPDGMDAEIFSFNVLETAWKEASEHIQREHVTPFIWQHPDRFTLGTLFPNEGDFSHMRWTVDNQEDFDFISWVYEQLYPSKPNFSMQDVLDLIKQNPEKAQGNVHLIGQEGYEQFRS